MLSDLIIYVRLSQLVNQLIILLFSNNYLLSKPKPAKTYSHYTKFSM